ncbi:hypothetical protein C0584_03150 [Candidatus Parcubacteria bacterium]|nr:MAG: hypothetical protein C0584_03150 [Candidatus Parcubacteria bacterium]
MSELKTQVNNKDPKKYIESIKDEGRKKDLYELLKIFKKVTRKNPKMWGDSIVGYGSYHYKSERSKQEGDWPLTGFSNRKNHLTIYIMPGFQNYQRYLKTIGKYKNSVSCLYVKKLEDINREVLEELIRESVSDMREMYGDKK